MCQEGKVYSNYFIYSEDDSLVFEWALCNNNIRASFDIEKGHYNACWTIVSTEKYKNLMEGKNFLYCRENEIVQATEEFIQKAKEIHKNKYDYNKTDYVETDKKVCITCPEHGDFFQRPSDHLSGKGCSKCANNIKHTKEDFIDLSRAVHGDKYNYSKVNYINNKTKVCIVCPIHEEFYMTPD